MPGMPGMPGMPPGMDPANFDPSKYMQAMSGMFQNPQFMQMAEKLGQAIIQVRVSQACSDKCVRSQRCKGDNGDMHAVMWRNYSGVVCCT
jgi:hypothetical protein